MPELPEVHTTATILDKLLKGLEIKAVWTNYKSPSHTGKDNIKDPKFFAGFARKISGARFLKVYRRGKNVLLDLDNGETMLIHMKMTGHLLYGTYKRCPVIPYRNSSSFGYFEKNTAKNFSLLQVFATQPAQAGIQKDYWEAMEKGPLQDSKNQFLRMVITLSNGKHLALSDMRKFAKVTLVPTEKIHASEHLLGVGPEPLEKKFTFGRFRTRMLTKPRGKIKQVLMNPEVIAGIGNIYSDEMLFLSDIHPLSIVSKIPEAKLKKLFTDMKIVLNKGIDFQGDSTSDYRNPFGLAGEFQTKHNAYRKTGSPCPKRDGGAITRLRLGGRNAHFCPVHQCLY